MQIHSNIYIFIYFLSSLITAQNAGHFNLWSRLSVTQSLNEKVKFENDLQHRRQNNFSNQSINALEMNLLSSIRSWVHYQHNESITFSVSPIAYYWHDSIIIFDSDKQKPQINESRYSIAVDLKHDVTPKLWLADRSCIEYRDFKNTNADVVRMRNRLGLRYDFNKNWNTVLYEEIFLNLEGATPHHFFDHERIALLLNYKPTKNIRLETGYLYITRLPKNSDEFVHENNFLIHLYYTVSQNNNNKHLKLQT